MISEQTAHNYRTPVFVYYEEFPSSPGAKQEDCGSKYSEVYLGLGMHLRCSPGCTAAACAVRSLGIRPTRALHDWTLRPRPRIFYRRLCSSR